MSKTWIPLKTFAQPLVRRFIGHEIWALRTAQSIPFFAIFAFATLWIWFIPILVPLSIAAIYLIEFPSFASALILFAIGGIGLGVTAPWFFRWSLICAHLMLGRDTAAQSKLLELEKRLDHTSRAK